MMSISNDSLNKQLPLRNKSVTLQTSCVDSTRLRINGTDECWLRKETGLKRAHKFAQS